MILTELDILDAFYSYASSQGIQNLVNGGMFRIPRPINSKKEDIVMSVLATGKGQIQPFVVNINVYVPDIRRGQEFILNEQKISTLMKEMLKVFEHGKIVFPSNGKQYDIIFELQSQKIYEVKGSSSHAINHKLDVRVCTE